jgi:hypothetical protein
VSRSEGLFTPSLIDVPLMYRGKMWMTRQRPSLAVARSLLLFFVSSVSFPGMVGGLAGAGELQFNRDVRPILADLCFTCHGPDNSHREAGLRLDTQEGAIDHGVIVPGDADGSEFVRRILSEDPDERMPPPSSPKSITPRQVELLRKWIDEGAEWEDHWSFIPPDRPTIPEVSDPSWVRNPVDHFLMRRWDELGIKPSTDADRRTLIRRLSFDLLGLPPTPEQVEAFLQDDTSMAYERLVDDMLASPQYGERMAMYWLDVVRYADTAGYHSDNHRDVWLYRDYVINAFNEDKPFDQFTIEQLAGDLLPNATREQRIASGYNRLLQTTEEGGAQPKEYTAKYLADRVRNTSVIWLGVTMGCSECHDHKFDPFSARDFYQLGAFFADIEERAVGRQTQTPLPTAEQEAEVAELDQQLQALENEVFAPNSELSAAQAEWEAEMRTRIASNHSAWTVIQPSCVKATEGTTLELLNDQSVLGSGENPDQDTFIIEGQVNGETITGLRLEALTHPSLVNGSLSRINGNFVLTGVTVEVSKGDGERAEVKLARAAADFSQPNYEIAKAIDGSSRTGWAVDGHNQVANRKGVFTFAEPITGATSVTVRLDHRSPHAKHQIGRFRLAVTGQAEPSLEEFADIPDDIVALLRMEPEALENAQRDQVFRHFRITAKPLEPVRAKIEALKKDRERLIAAYPTTLVSTSVSPRVVRILPRGNWLDDSGEVVSPGVPKSLHPLDGHNPPDGPESIEVRPTRLDLARWMVAPENPLSARVFVNRLWKLSFGEGLVRTLEDFGLQGEWPSHPALLDWLAVEFQESGWNVKQIHRLLVTSRAYQQSSLSREDLRELDPENRLLARQARYRLEAEFLRDNALSVSGLLTRRIGGPSVKPYQPAGYWANLNFPRREWESDSGESLYRRGLYTYWCRSFLHPGMLAFDAPSREECVAERPRSNTPLQALVLLNDPTFVEAATALAVRLVRDVPESPEAKVQQAFRWTLGRAPREMESQMLVELLEAHQQQFSEDKRAAEELLGTGQFPVPAEMDRAALAAWTSVARVILNLHESVTRN